MRSLKEVEKKVSKEIKKESREESRQEKKRRKKEKELIAKHRPVLNRLVLEMEQRKPNWNQRDVKERQRLVECDEEPMIKMCFALYYYLDVEFFGKQKMPKDEPKVK